MANTRDGFEIDLDPTVYSRGAKALRKRAPVLFDKMFVAWLMTASNEFRADCLGNAGNISGVTNNYRGGFKVSAVQGDMGSRYQMIYNQTPYSLVIEFGGQWSKHPHSTAGPGTKPPPSVLDEWIRKFLQPKDETELKQIAYLIGRKLIRSGSSAEGAHGSLVMTGTLQQDRNKLKKMFKGMLKRAIKDLESFTFLAESRAIKKGGYE